MAISPRLVVGISTLAGVAAGLRLLSKRRAARNPYGLPDAQLSEEEREQATAVFQAMQENTTEAPATG